MSLGSLLDGVEQHVRALAKADSPPDVFRSLLNATSVAAPRAAIFLVRRGRIHGWGSLGYEADVAQKQRAFSCEAGVEWAQAEASASHPEFGQPPAAEVFRRALMLRVKPIAILHTERRAGEEPWLPRALDVLVTVAQLRLELALAQRPQAAGRPAAEEVPPPQVELQIPIPDAPAPAESAAEVTAIRPVDETDAKNLDPEVAAAQRFARLVATDIRLYNEEAVVLGRRHRDLGERLGEHLTRGKQAFLKRHGSLGPTGLEILLEAYVQVLAAGDSALLPTSVLD